eukprot:13804784-Alexandrium_andersonii.AAC.1
MWGIGPPQAWPQDVLGSQAAAAASTLDADRVASLGVAVVFAKPDVLAEEADVCAALDVPQLQHRPPPFR